MTSRSTSAIRMRKLARTVALLHPFSSDVTSKLLIRDAEHFYCPAWRSNFSLFYRPCQRKTTSFTSRCFLPHSGISRDGLQKRTHRVESGRRDKVGVAHIHRAELSTLRGPLRFRFTVANKAGAPTSPYRRIMSRMFINPLKNLLERGIPILQTIICAPYFCQKVACGKSSKSLRVSSTH